jgi:signal transduction histidine kinase
LTGFILSSILWSESLEGVFAEQVSGVDCVLETETLVYTYTVFKGHATVKGEGDLHDARFNKYAKSTSLTGKPGAYFSNFSASYTLTLYPNEELFQVYSTPNPFVATIGAVCVIVFTSLLFFLYDFFVRQEFNEKRSVLEAKRSFIRFVSHEVRTPLNAACMGLRLLQEEIGRTLNVGIYAGSSTPHKNISKLPPTNSESQISFAKDILGLSQEVMSNAESAVDILNDLLNYDKIEMGTMKLELTVVPIWDLVERTVSEFKLTATAQKINAIVDFGSLVAQPNGNDDETDLESVGSIHANQLPNAIREYRILGDTIRLTQVLRNLLSNALKFTPEGGKWNTTAATTTRHGNPVILLQDSSFNM